MTRLLTETHDAQKKVLWGPERGWTDTQDDTHEKHGLTDVDAAFDGLRAYSSDVVEALSNSLQTIKLESC
jgi:16S rRNA U1498 N3-methylase RsmE